MAARVNAREVKEIIAVDDSIPDIGPFITAANLFVSNNLSGQGLSAELLKEIERNVAAHFITNADPRATEEKMGDGATKYQGKFGKGLHSSSYGQTAMLLDSSGKLATAGNKKATFGIISYSTASDANRSVT